MTNTKENYWPFEELRVWQESMELTVKVYHITKKFPNSEQYGLTSQTRRSSTSVPLNIAEGKGRKTDKDFAKFLMIARASLHEVVTCFKLAMKLKYITENESQPFMIQAFKINSQLNSLINSLKK